MYYSLIVGHNFIGYFNIESKYYRVSGWKIEEFNLVNDNSKMSLLLDNWLYGDEKF